MDGAIGQGVGLQLQTGVPQRARAQHATALLPGAGHGINLPIQPRIRQLPARVRQRLAVDARLAGGVKFELGSDLIELQGQRRLKLVQDVLAKQATQHPACQQQRHRQTDQRRR